MSAASEPGPGRRPKSSQKPRRRNPTDPRWAALATLQTSFDADPQAIVTQTEPLTSGDLELIGTVVQLYCAADFNGRRILDVLRHAARGEQRLASRLQDGQVFPLIEEIAKEHLGGGHLRDGLVKACATIEMHRELRHNFAHWVVRRAKGADALIMFSMNAKEAERRDGLGLMPEQSKYGILALDGVDLEVRRLNGHVEFLAATAPRLESGVDELRDAIAAVREHNSERA